MLTDGLANQPDERKLACLCHMYWSRLDNKGMILALAYPIKFIQLSMSSQQEVTGGHIAFGT